MRGCWIAIVLALFATLSAAAQENASDAALEASGQLIVVSADDWSANHGTLVLLERGGDRTWRRASTDIPVMLGRSGLAWGVGLHSERPTKREGDGRSPAGVFELARIYGRDTEPPSAHFTYQQLSETMEGIDDPRSRYYNRLVDASRIRDRDWSCSEKVRAANPMFRWCVEVKHNWAQQPALGSCIYLHIWKAPGVATSGCTAMDAPALERLVRWLDVRQRPLLVQMPRAQFRRLRIAASLAGAGR